MTFLTNLFLAVPTFIWFLLAMILLAYVFVLLEELRFNTKERRVKLALRDVTIVVVLAGSLLAITSPKVWLSKESTKSVDKLPDNSLNLKLDDELRGAQETKDRVPKPQERALFVHELGKKKE